MKTVFPKSIFSSLLFLTLLVVGLQISFPYCKEILKSPNARMFELEKRATWTDSRPFWGGILSGVTRLLAMGNFETMLLSRDVWRNYTLSFSILNPGDFGVAFHVEDEKNYRFIYFYFEGKKIVWGAVINGEVTAAKAADLDVDFDQDFKLVVGPMVQFFNGHRLIVQKEFPQKDGKFALVLNQVPEFRTQFNYLGVIGVKQNGIKENIKPIKEKALSVPWIALVFYLLVLASGKCLVEILTAVRRWIIKEKFNGAYFFMNPVLYLRNTAGAMDAADKIFYGLALLIGSLVFTRFLQILEWIRFKRFWDKEELIFFGMSLGVYFLFVLLAYIYQKAFKLLNVPILFIGFLFTVYFLCLMNIFTLQIDDHAFLRFCVVGFFILAVGKMCFHFKKERVQQQLPTAFTFLDVLIIVWLLYSLFYCLDYNFYKFRYPHTDEQYLWFLAARNMVDTTIAQANCEMYPAGRTHALGVPFIAALPNIILKTSQLNLVFFMPLVVMIGLFIFLNALKASRWCFLFFYMGLFLSFDFNWLGHLIYRSMYAEGIALLFFLFITYSIWSMAEAQQTKRRDFLVLSFLIGLLALCKLPVAYFSLIFVLVMIMATWFSSGKRITGVVLGGAGMLLSLIPAWSWKKMLGFCQVESHSFATSLADADFGHIKKEMLCKAVHYIGSNYEWALLWTLLALVFFFTGIERKKWVHIVPVLCLIIFVFIYYGWVFIGVDHESAARYVSSQMLALYFLGGMGLERLMRKRNIDRRVVK